jgi:hypothetical protein
MIAPMSNRRGSQAFVLVALWISLAAVPSAHAAPDKEGYRQCTTLEAKSKTPITTGDLEAIDCYLDFVSELSLESHKGDVAESGNCPSEAMEDQPYAVADAYAGVVRSEIQAARAAHERTYALIDSYLGAKRSYYQAKYLDTPKTRSQIDMQINLVGQKVKAFRDDEREFLMFEEAYAGSLAAHDCGGAATQTGLMFNPVIDLGDSLGPEVNTATAKLLALVKLPAKKKRVPNRTPAKSKAGKKTR